MLGRRNRQLPLVLETGNVRHIALLKIGVRVGGHDLWFWRQRWGFCRERPAYLQAFCGWREATQRERGIAR